MIPVVAVLAGQYQGVSRLSQVDQFGRLLVQTQIDPPGLSQQFDDAFVLSATPADIVLGVAGLTITLYELRMSVTRPIQVGPVTLTDSSGSVLDWFDASLNGLQVKNYNGRQLTVGRGLQWRNNNPTAVGVFHSLRYIRA